MEHSYRLIIACPDSVGIVARVSAFIASHGGSFEANYHTDHQIGQFFMRNEINAKTLKISFKTLKKNLISSLKNTICPGICDSSVLKR